MSAVSESWPEAYRANNAETQVLPLRQPAGPAPGAAPLPRGSPITIRGDVPSRVTGVPYDTLRIECKAGRLRSQLPEGRKVGRMVRPEWVEQWIEEGTHGIEAA